MKELKVSVMKKIEEWEDVILRLEEWDPEILSRFGNVDTEEQRDAIIENIKKDISELKENIPDDGKLYLSEIVKKENIKFDKNSLILAPVGSGKTFLIHEILKETPGKALMLVSNLALKDHVSPNDNEIKEERADRTYTTQNNRIFGKESYEVHVMSYSEFGKRIKINDDFIEDIKLIFCDEIHSLPDYQGFQDSATLAIAIKALFKRYEDKEIYYFTATDEYLVNFERRNPGALKNIKYFDFLNHPEIKQYIPLSEYKFNHIEQVRPHLKSRLRTFKYFGYKSLAFSRTISGQKKIAEMAQEEGFNPIMLWSVNAEDSEMTKEQLKVREYLLNYGEIPDPYNFLIINSAMQEGWNLHDSKVKLAIMNTTSETERVQALGRLRNDIDILAYKVKLNEVPDITVNIPKKYMNIPLTTKGKDDLVEELNIKNSNGELSRWRAIKRIVLNNSDGYGIKDHTITLDGKRTRVSTIYYKEDFE